MMRFSRRQFLVITGQLTAGAVLGACAAPTPGSSPSSDNASEAPVTLRVHINSGVYGDFTQMWGERFTEEHPDIQITVESFPTAGGEYHAKLRAMHATGEIGDMVWTWATAGQLPELSHLGLWQPIDELVEADQFDLGQYFPSVIQGLQFEGQLMGLPFHAHPGFPQFSYNVDMFNQAGVDLPTAEWTLADIVDAAQKLTIREGDRASQYGWMSLTGWHVYIIWARIFGTDLLSEDGTQSLVNSPEFTASLQWTYDNINMHKIEPSVTEVEGGSTDMFAAQRVAMTQIDSSAIGPMYKRVEDAFEWAVALLPAGPTGQRGALATPHIYGITANSQAREAAWEFLKSITGHEAGVVKVLEGAGAPGGRPDCWNDARIKEFAPGYEIVAQAFDYAWPERTPANFRGIQVANAIDQNLANIWTGNAAVEEGAQTADEAAQAVLDMSAE